MGCPSGAARARAVRRRWRRQIGNDGLARVLVPDGEDLSPKWTPPARLNDSDATPQTDPPPPPPRPPGRPEDSPPARSRCRADGQVRKAAGRTGRDGEEIGCC